VKRPPLKLVPEGCCPWSDCWCRAWPIVRLVRSTDTYTVEELPGDGTVRVFRYRYLEAA